MNILNDIVKTKKKEIQDFYRTHDWETLHRLTLPTPRSFTGALEEARRRKTPFFITEFKRKSPSEGWIFREADVESQILRYTQAGAGAISVLTDAPWFGGSYEDLRRAAAALDTLPAGSPRPLLLQKDFVLDPVQVYLARQAGADLILLIAAILEPEQIEELLQTAAKLGMGAILEVHDAAELAAVQHLDFPVLGINNRDLKTFRTALNRFNVVARQARGRYVIAESGLYHQRDFRIVERADGFLIGTHLMREASKGRETKDADLLQKHFNPSAKRPLLKACGIRTPELLREDTADWIGINFSPVSRRRIDTALLDGLSTWPDNAVALFYKNSLEEIHGVLARYPFKTVQLYADDITPQQLHTIRRKVMLALSLRQPSDLDRIEQYAADIDLFILDGAQPGSGQALQTAVPRDFPYPFLLAGGLRQDNAQQMLQYERCIGIDVASGIETDGHTDATKIKDLHTSLIALAINS